VSSLFDDDRKQPTPVRAPDHEISAWFLVTEERRIVPPYLQHLVEIDAMVGQLVLGARRNAEYVDVAPCHGQLQGIQSVYDVYEVYAPRYHLDA